MSKSIPLATILLSSLLALPALADGPEGPLSPAGTKTTEHPAAARLPKTKPSTTVSGTWQTLRTPLCPSHQNCPFPSNPVLLTDGSVMIHASCDPRWFKLTPDETGSYVNGSWSNIASLPAGYAPQYNASALLPDGRVLIEGGEYNNAGAGCAAAWTNKGAIYDPATDTWTMVNPPAGWANIGDAQSVLMANGLFMLANCCTKEQAILDPKALTWTSTGSGKVDINDEEGWTLLPDGTVLTVDANNPADLTHTELYDPRTGAWASAGETLEKLDDTNANNSGSHEMGPQLRLQDGMVFAVGATGATGLFKKPGVWLPGPSFADLDGAGQLDTADGPAAILPDGNVLVSASPGVFQSPNHFYEFDGQNLIEVNEPASAQFASSYWGNMIELPTGQTMLVYIDSFADISIYTPTGNAQDKFRPKVQQVPFTLVHGQTYTLKGKHLAGFSAGAAYGDDFQGQTNYPLVRLTNVATGHVIYCPTTGLSSYAPANPQPVTVSFTVPAGVELGDSQIEVITNGIASQAQAASVM